MPTRGFTMATNSHCSHQPAEDNTLFEIVREPIDPRVVESSVARSSSGAVVTFCGVVRENADDGEAVDGLRYEAHEAMAVRSFMEIAQEVRTRHPDATLAIVHRVGELKIGEIAVVTVAAAPHRADAFLACREAIDALKARSPIWKQEYYRSGARRWVSNDCSEHGH
ncbi:MAG TPA: molybdenum cofactor biosynthesis protein MoaE, partial [Candidatus Dormibacteraeota bacterium]|nr:molybdenum cofactor biosynthesis protein MoaE [Candidatus Dormibacteraeota bacterium]